MTMVSPRIIKEKNSGGPNRRARLATTGAITDRPTMARVPAMKDPMAAIPRAGPALPCLGHLIAVETGGHAGGFTGDIDQD